EVRPSDGPAIALYPADRAGYGRLARLLTTGKLRAEKGACALALEDIAARAEGLLAIIVPPEVLDPSAIAAVARPREPFGDRAYVALERHLGPRDRARGAEVAALAERLGASLVACNDVHMHAPARQRLQDVLACIREGVTIDEAGARLFPNAERR